MKQATAVRISGDPGGRIFAGKSDPVDVGLPEQDSRLGLAKQDLETGQIAEPPKFERVAVVRQQRAELAAAPADPVELRGPAMKGGLVDPIFDRKLGTQDVAVADCQVVLDFRVERSAKAIGADVAGDDPDPQIVQNAAQLGGFETAVAKRRLDRVVAGLDDLPQRSDVIRSRLVAQAEHL